MMSLSYTIDHEQRVVRSHGWGIVSTGNLQEWISRLLAEPQFDSSYGSLGDLRGVTAVVVDSTTLARIASTPLFHVGALRAIVAPADNVFGTARMFASFAERIGQQVRVFREMYHAEEWLGLLLPPAGGLAGNRPCWEPSDARPRSAA
jgi:hypothetical protein